MKDLFALKDGDVSSFLILKDKEKLKTQFRDSFGSLYLGRRCDLVVESDEDFMALFYYLLRMGLGIDVRVSEAFKPVLAPLDDKAVQVLAESAHQASTHTSKTVDMRIPHRQMMAWPKPVSGAINSGDARHSRPVYGCGQSAQSMARLFWTRDFVDAREGETSRTCLLLSFRDPVIQWILDGLMTKGQKQLLNEAAEQFGGHAMPAEPGPKQVFLPMMNESGEVDDYLLVSPVFSLSMAEEFYHGVHRFYDRHQTEVGEHPFLLRKPKSQISVGGTKPQNIGDFFSTIAGRIRCLEAKPPYTRRKPSLADRAADGFNLLCLKPSLNPEAQWIARRLLHENQVSSYRRAFKAYLIEAFRLVRVYRKQRQADDSPWPLPKDAGGIDGLARAMLEKKQLESGEIDRFTDVLINAIQRQGMPAIKLNDLHLMVMRPEIKGMLRRWRNIDGGQS